MTDTKALPPPSVTLTNKGLITVPWYNYLRGTDNVLRNSAAAVGSSSSGYAYIGNFSGADAGVQIKAAIDSLPSTGGIVDATGLIGAQTINADPFSSSTTKPITLLLGAATYTVNSSTWGILLSSNQRIIGFGRGVTVIKIGTVSGTAGVVGVSGTNPELAHLSVDGTGGGAPVAAVYVAATNPSVHDLYFTAVTTPSSATIFLRGSTRAKINNIWINGSAGGHGGGAVNVHGIQINETSPADGYNEISNITVNGGGFGLSLVKSNKNVISNYISTATTYLSLEGFNIDTSNDNLFVNIYSDGRGDGGYVETSSLRNHITGGTFTNQAYMGLFATGTDCVYENIVSFNNGNGNTSYSASGVWISDGSGSGWGTATRVTLHNVTSFDNRGGSAVQTYGLVIDASVTDTVVTGLLGYGNATAFILDSGTNSAIGARNTGWTAMTGSPDKATAYATSTVTLPQLAGRVAELQAILTTQGLIGA